MLIGRDLPPKGVPVRRLNGTASLVQVNGTNNSGKKVFSLYSKPFEDIRSPFFPRGSRMQAFFVVTFCSVIVLCEQLESWCQN